MLFVAEVAGAIIAGVLAMPLYGGGSMSVTDLLAVPSRIYTARRELSKLHCLCIMK